MEQLPGILAVTFIFGGATTYFLASSPIGKAIADRIRGGPAGRDVRALEEQYEGLVDEVETMRGEMTDLQERLDFTERLLAKEPESKLPPGTDVQG